jgi:hypothetical protein
MDLIQLVLDGDRSAADLDADLHSALCGACRARIAAARLLAEAFSTSAASLRPPGLTDNILAAVREDRLSRIRHRSYGVVVAAAVAIAACLVIASWFRTAERVPVVPENATHRNAQDQTRMPLAPDPHPLRLGEEFARVGHALRDTSKPIMEPAASASEMFGMLTSSLTVPAPPGGDIEAGNPLAELSAAARTGLEPVTSTTQKAFARLMRDIGSVQVNVKPKS